MSVSGKKSPKAEVSPESDSFRGIKSFVRDSGIREHNLKNELQNVYDGACIRKKANWVVSEDEHKFDNPKFDPVKMKEAIAANSPKLEALLKKIADLDKKDMETDGHLYKHFIFSDIRFNGYGAKMVASGLIANGMRLGYTAKPSGKKHGKIEMLPNQSGGNTFYLLASINVYDQPIQIGVKRAILDTFNKRPDNVHGDIARIIVMDSGYKEGIDLFDIKYIHIFEPSMHNADQKQVIGRGTRTCGQKGLAFHPTKGWPLYVYIYDIGIPEEHQHEFMDSKTLFDLYIKSSNIDTRFFEFQKDLERVIVYGSVDYELNKAIHNFSTRVDEAEYVLGGNEKYKRERPAKAPLQGNVGVWGQNLGTGARTFATGARTFATGARTFADAVKYGKLPEILLDKSGNRFDKMRQYISHFFGEYKWKNIQMENQCETKEQALVAKERALVAKERALVAKEKKGGTRRFNHSQVGSGKNRTRKNSEAPAPGRERSDSVLKPPTDEKKVFDTVTGDKYVSRFPKSVIPGYGQRVYNPAPIEEEEESKEETPESIKLKKLASEKAKKFIQLTPTQQFISQFFKPELPLKGMLLWHSVGTGKTCTAIATASNEFEKQGYTILWVTKATLKSEIFKNIFDQICSFNLRERILQEGLEIPADPKKRLELLTRSWDIQPISYKQLSNLVERRNSFYDQIVKVNPKNDPLHKTLLIIDEAQKLYGASDLVYTERPDMESIERAIQNSYEVSGEDSVKILLMTATPITSDPMEILKLINLTKPRREQITTHFEEFSRQYLDETGKFSQEGERDFLNAITGSVSYLNREKDARQFSQPIVKHVSIPLSKGNSELMEYDPKYVKEVAKSEIAKIEEDVKRNQELIATKYKRVTKSSFDYVKDECKSVEEPGEKARCLSEAKAKIMELYGKAKEEEGKLKAAITGMNKQIKAITEKKKDKLEQIEEYFRKNPEKANKFMKSMYYSLQDECARKVTVDNLAPFIEQHPDIVRYDRELKYFDEKVVELRMLHKDKIEEYGNRIAALNEEMKQPDLKKYEKDQIKTRIASVKREMTANTSDKGLVAETRKLATRKKEKADERDKHKKTLRNQIKKYFDKDKKRREEIEKRELLLIKEREKQEELMEKLRLEEEKRKAKEDVKRKEAEEKQAEKEGKRKVAEEKKRVAEEKRRLAAEKKRENDVKKAEIALKKQKAAEEKARIAEEKQQKKEQEKLQKEQEQRRKEEAKAEKERVKKSSRIQMFPVAPQEEKNVEIPVPPENKSASKTGVPPKERSASKTGVPPKERSASKTGVPPENKSASNPQKE